MTLCDIDDRIKAVIVTGQFLDHTRLRSTPLMTPKDMAKCFAQGKTWVGINPLSNVIRKFESQTNVMGECWYHLG